MKARITPIAIVVVLLFSFGCNESVEVLCDDIAQRQCERCSTCAAEVDDGSLTSREVCGVSKGNCEADFREQCEYQSSTLEDPKERLDECIQSLNSLTCDSVLTGYTVGSRVTTYECEYFL